MKFKQYQNKIMIALAVFGVIITSLFKVTAGIIVMSIIFGYYLCEESYEDDGKEGTNG